MNRIKFMKCEFCGNDHEGSYGSGRFCSPTCARSFATKYREPKLIIKKCKYCGKEISVKLGISDNNVICNDCKEKHSKKICKICGSPYLHSCKNDFCKSHGPQQFNALIKYFGFDPTKLGTPEVEDEFNRIRDKLYKDYWVDELTTSQMSEKYGYPSPCNFAGKIFKYLNIPTRSIKENNKKQPFYRKNTPRQTPHYKNGWHKTWDGDEVYLRSSYEFDFAKILDSKRIHYEVENLRVKYFDRISNEYRCAIPDFVIPETKTIYEIKSSYTYDKDNMDDKVIAYKSLGYSVILVLEHKEIPL